MKTDWIEYNARVDVLIRSEIDSDGSEAIEVKSVERNPYDEHKQRQALLNVLASRRLKILARNAHF